MSCYNPLQLPMYDDDEGGRVYITCTFVNSFSGVVHKQQKCDPFFSNFPMFVPSLSWQNDRFYYKMARVLT